MKDIQYIKRVLGKVSFDRQLLGKEYRKAIKRLSKEEANSLQVWYKANFKTVENIAKLSET